MIIDCHTHLSKFNHQGQSYSTIRDDLLNSMQEEEVDYAFIYPDSESDTDVADLDSAIEVIKDCPKLFLLGTIAIPISESKILSKLNGLAASKKIIGIKLYPGFELFYPDDKSCYPIYELCIRHNMPVVFHSGETKGENWREEYNHPDRIVRVAKQFPELRIVIAHFSQPHLVACQNAVLRLSNIYADISGLAHPEVEDLCGREFIHQVLADVATIRPEKIIFGTDWPICDIGKHRSLIESLPFSIANKRLILSENALHVFALNNML